MNLKGAGCLGIIPVEEYSKSVLFQDVPTRVVIPGRQFISDLPNY